MKKTKKLKLKKEHQLYVKPKTQLQCDACEKIQVIDGIVYGTDPVFVGMHRKCSKCGHVLFNRI